MRTLLFLVVGLLLLAACLLLGRLFAGSYPSATELATIAFISLWLAIAGANLWVGVAKAGYTITDELPIFTAGVWCTGADRGRGQSEVSLRRRTAG